MESNEKDKNLKEEDAESIDEEVASEACESKEESRGDIVKNKGSSLKDISKEEKDSKSFFKKKKEKKDEKDEKIEDLNDRLMRKAAEFDNFRKRNEKEKSQMFEIGAKNIVETILPVIDSFERGLGTVPEEQKEDPFVEGMEKVYKQFITCLEEVGVEPIEAMGKEFDPNLHNAVMHEEDPDQGDNIIIEEFQKGYTYKGNIVRYSMVKVAN